MLGDASNTSTLTEFYIDHSKCDGVRRTNSSNGTTTTGPSIRAFVVVQGLKFERTRHDPDLKFSVAIFFKR